METTGALSAREVIVGKLTAIEDNHIILGASRIRVPDPRLLDGIEVGMSLTLVVTRHRGHPVAERILRFDEDHLRIVGLEGPTTTVEKQAAAESNPGRREPR